MIYPCITIRQFGILHQVWYDIMIICLEWRALLMWLSGQTNEFFFQNIFISAIMGRFREIGEFSREGAPWVPFGSRREIHFDTDQLCTKRSMSVDEFFHSAKLYHAVNCVDSASLNFDAAIARY
jgi:hypothetical protein